MNILAIDYGTKNIGLAWVDTEVGVVLPYGLMTNDRDNMTQKLIDFVRKEKIHKLVVGLPLGLDGQENENTMSVRAFVEELKKEAKVSVEFVDERFTSAEADRMENSGASRDERAAMVILQAYLERLANSI